MAGGSMGAGRQNWVTRLDDFDLVRALKTICLLRTI